jgi:hypothetical protein
VIKKLSDKLKNRIINQKNIAINQKNRAINQKTAQFTIFFFIFQKLNFIPKTDQFFGFL